MLPWVEVAMSGNMTIVIFCYNLKICDLNICTCDVDVDTWDDVDMSSCVNIKCDVDLRGCWCETKFMRDAMLTWVVMLTWDVMLTWEEMWCLREMWCWHEMWCWREVQCWCEMLCWHEIDVEVRCYVDMRCYDAMLTLGGVDMRWCWCKMLRWGLYWVKLANNDNCKEHALYTLASCTSRLVNQLIFASDD